MPLLRIPIRPADPRSLGLLRISLGTLVLVQAVLLWPDIELLFGERGFIQSEIIIDSLPSFTPRLDWACDILAHAGLSQNEALSGLFAFHICSAFVFIVGYKTRVAALLLWLSYLLIYSAGEASNYGVHGVFKACLFYSLFFPVGVSCSLDSVAKQPPETRASTATTTSLYLLRLHLTVLYFSSGAAKAAGEQWWTGEAIWRAVLRPEFENDQLSWLSDLPLLLRTLSIGTVLIELLYSLLPWFKATRTPYILLLCTLHASIAVLMDLWLFSCTMIALNACCWLKLERLQKLRPQESVRSLEAHTANAICVRQECDDNTTTISKKTDR